jgi:hypothetical protein
MQTISIVSGCLSKIEQLLFIIYTNENKRSVSKTLPDTGVTKTLS